MASNFTKPNTCGLIDVMDDINSQRNFFNSLQTHSSSSMNGLVTPTCGPLLHAIPTPLSLFPVILQLSLSIKDNESKIFQQKNIFVMHLSLLASLNPLPYDGIISSVQSAISRISCQQLNKSPTLRPLSLSASPGLSHDVHYHLALFSPCQCLSSPTGSYIVFNPLSWLCQNRITLLFII